MRSRVVVFAVAVMITIVAAVMMLSPFTATAQASPCGFQTAADPFAFESVTVSTVSIGFTSATYAPSGAQPADLAVVSTETAGIRYRTDGSAPTAAIGHAMASDSEFVVCGRAAIVNFRGIRSGGSDATIRVTFFRAKG